MIIRIIPPQSSARNFRAMPQPKRIPNSNPMRDITKDTKPMIEMGASISEKSRIPRNANETPMASASILVATANASTTFRLFGSYSFLQSSSLKDSLTMRPPRKARMMNAIQWSRLSIRWLNVLAPIHPNRGIRAWKKPKV